MPSKPRLLSNEFPVHITARSNNQDHFPLSLYRTWEILSEQLYFLSHAFELRIISFVLMPNHFHLLVRDPNLNMSEGMQFFMRESAKQINRESKRKNRVWGGRYHSSIIDSSDYLETAYKYVYRNPVKAKLAGNVLDYRFSTLSTICGSRHSVIPLEEDKLFFQSSEATLRWLNKPFKREHDELIRKSLKRKVMKFEVSQGRRTVINPASLTRYSYEKEAATLG